MLQTFIKHSNEPGTSNDSQVDRCNVSLSNFFLCNFLLRLFEILSHKIRLKCIYFSLKIAYTKRARVSWMMNDERPNESILDWKLMQRSELCLVQMKAIRHFFFASYILSFSFCTHTRASISPAKHTQLEPERMEKINNNFQSMFITISHCCDVNTCKLSELKLDGCEQNVTSFWHFSYSNLALRTSCVRFPILSMAWNVSSNFCVAWKCARFDDDLW